MEGSRKRTMFDSRRLGAALREARMEKNYTQEYLAELLNITPTHMKHIESGHRKPSIEVYFKMVEVLGFSTDNFLLAEAPIQTEAARRELTLLLTQCGPDQLRVLQATAQALLDTARQPADTQN